MAGEEKLFRQELSTAEQWRLVHLRNWLVRTPWNPTTAVRSSLRRTGSSGLELDVRGISFRIAPSIIVRSEAELLGINSPRFALRACFDREGDLHPGFVNLRRLKTFREAVSKRLRLYEGHKLLDSLARVGCLADGFLNPQIAYPDYITITTSLAAQYGEEGPERGVPFVTHFPIGGGLCAQAICFQATLLRYRNARSVYGVSEITLLATDRLVSGAADRVPAESTYLNFSGLRRSQIAAFLNHPQVGLGTTVERLFYPSKPDKSAERRTRWKVALLAYLRSGIPVILPVDGHRMAGAFSADFPAALLPRYSGDQTEMHCVLAVGFDPHGERVLLNDPSTFPLLDCALNDLFDMAPEQTGAPRHWMIPVHASPGFRPLLDYDNTVVPGVLENTRVWGQRNSGFGPTDFTRSDWLLLEAGTDIRTDLETRLTGPFEAQLPSKALLQQTADWLEQNAATAGVRHVWLEYAQGRGGRLWDAREASDSTAAIRKHPGACLVEFRDDVTFSLPVATEPTPRPAERCGETHAEKTAERTSGTTSLIRPAVISSFSTDGIALSCRQLQRGNRKELIELYAFMQPDSDRLLKREIGYTGSDRLDAVEMMGSFASDVAVARIVRRLQKLPQGALYRIAALATFIPEIADPPGSPRAQMAGSALQFISRLALEIRRHQVSGNQLQELGLPGLKAIEIVAGSRITSVFSAILPDAAYPQLIAQTTSDSEAAKNTIGNLAAAISEACRQPANHVGKHNKNKKLLLRQALHDAGISVCLELEPGPLYALRNLDTLETFCEEINRCAKDLKDGFPAGFNLDIAHWRMAGLTPEMIPLNVRQRIGHSHIAGHDVRGHLGDTALGQKDLADCRPWLSLLQRLHTLPDRKIPYSGILSVEFEASRDVQDVFRTLDTVSSWL